MIPPCKPKMPNNPRNNVVKIEQKKEPTPVPTKSESKYAVEENTPQQDGSQMLKKRTNLINPVDKDDEVKDSKHFESKRFKQE